MMTLKEHKELAKACENMRNTTIAGSYVEAVETIEKACELILEAYLNTAMNHSTSSKLSAFLSKLKVKKNISEMTFKNYKVEAY